MTQLISKVKILSANKTEIELEEKVIDKDTKTTKKVTTDISSDEVRHRDFNAAGDALVPFIRKMFGFPEKWEVEFKGLSIHREHGFAVNINTYVRFNQEEISGGASMPLPLLSEESKNGQNEISVQLKDAIMAFLNEVDAFAFAGKQAQASLSLDEPKTDEELDEQEKQNIATPPGTSKKRNKIFGAGVIKAVAHDNKKRA